MKTKPSHYVLAAEVLIIVLLHTMKIRQNEKHPADTALNLINKSLSIQKPDLINERSVEYMLVNLVK